MLGINLAPRLCMLKRLTIEQFVIIDKLTIEFKDGLTVLTGETGAGKSILLDAMGLILGDPPNREAVRQEAQESILEALLAPPPGHPVWQFITENGLPEPPQHELLIRRTIGREDKDEILVNGKTVALDILKGMGTFLVEIHGQFANQSLLEPSNQMHLLDLYGNYPPEILKNVRDSLHDVDRYTKELEEERVFLARHAHEQMQVQQVVEKMQKLGMRKGFYEDVKAEHARMQTAKETSEVFQAVLAQLVASTGAEQCLVKSNNTLMRSEHLEKEKMAALSKHLSAALESTRGAIEEMTRLAPDYNIDTAPLRQYESVLDTLRAIAEEHNIKIEGIFDLYEQLSTKLARIVNGREQMRHLEDMVEKSKQAYREHAHILTKKRTEAGKALSAAITAELPPLKLMRAQFDVQVTEHPDGEWTELGFNTVIFTARMNPGMPFSPIIETASGGELARLILALKVVLQAVQTTGTLVFDEVDTGIGGAAAAAVGERIARLAAQTQVMCITHSPQVASRGNQHLHVSKKTDGITTNSVVRTLELKERIDEISRMLAGDAITDESQAAAKSLIEEASRAAELRQQPSPQESRTA